MRLHRAAGTPDAVPAPLPREPRDCSRPVLRLRGDADPSDPRLSVCPVCGMDGDEVSLDGGFCEAWPAHALCVEWLGGWKPAPGTPAAVPWVDPSALAAAAARVAEAPERAQHAAVPEQALRVLARMRREAENAVYYAVLAKTAAALGLRSYEVEAQMEAAGLFTAISQGAGDWPLNVR